MPYQYKREPLNDDEVDALANACESFQEKFVIWTLLDPAGPASLTLSAANAQQASNSVALTYTLSAPAEVEATIMNIAGRLVAQITSSAMQEEGVNTLRWNGRNTSGSLVPSGLYLIQVSAKAEEGAAAQLLCPLQLRP